MRLKFLILMAVVLLFNIPLTSPVYSDDAAEVEQESEHIDETAKTEDGQKTVNQNLKDRFNVEQTTIDKLRKEKFGYGEIATTLSLAERMEGGVKDENIQKIVDMRSGDKKKGWGQIAKEFDVKMGDLKKNVREVHKSVDAEEAKHAAGQHKTKDTVESEPMHTMGHGKTKTSSPGNHGRGHASNAGKKGK